ECAAVVKFGRNRHGSAEPPHQRAHMRKPHALTGLVLRSGASEQIEDALMIPGVDAAAVVDDLEDREAEFGTPADQDIAGNSGLEIFQRVVDQVGKYLLQRQMIAGKIRQRLDANLRFGFSRLMR